MPAAQSQDKHSTSPTLVFRPSTAPSASHSRSNMLVKLRNSKLPTLKPAKKRNASEKSGKTNSLKPKPSKLKLKTIQISLKLCSKATKLMDVLTTTTSESSKLSTTGSSPRKRTKITNLLPLTLKRFRSMSLILELRKLEKIAQLLQLSKERSSLTELLSALSLASLSSLSVKTGALLEPSTTETTSMLVPALKLSRALTTNSPLLTSTASLPAMSSTRAH